MASPLAFFFNQTRTLLPEAHQRHLRREPTAYRDDSSTTVNPMRHPPPGDPSRYWYYLLLPSAALVFCVAALVTYATEVMHRPRGLNPLINKRRQRFIEAHAPPTYPRLGIIQAETGRELTLATSITDETLAKCNPQQQCPLFAQLPAEVRALIFTFATAPYDSPKLEEQYLETDFFYRPSHRARHLTSTSLLLTCRRIWLEAHHLPLLQAQPTFWFGAPGRRPAWANQQSAATPLADYRTPAGHLEGDTNRLRRTLERFTPLNRQDARVQLFAQMFWLRYQSSTAYPVTQDWPRLGVKALTLTIRHSDWYYWESDAPLDLGDHPICRWLQDMTVGAEDRELRLVFETLVSKVAQLDEVIAKLIETVGVIRDASEREAKYSMALQDPPSDYYWIGPTNLGGEIRPVYEGLRQLKYVVKTVVWKKTALLPQVPSDTSEPATENTGFETDKRMAPVTRADSASMHAVERWRARWSVEGSLLEFVE